MDMTQSAMNMILTDNNFNIINKFVSEGKAVIGHKWRTKESHIHPWH